LPSDEITVKPTGANQRQVEVENQVVSIFQPDRPSQKIIMYPSPAPQCIGDVAWCWIKLSSSAKLVALMNTMTPACGLHNRISAVRKS
jgi:hypothetical protein